MYVRSFVNATKFLVRIHITIIIICTLDSRILQDAYTHMYAFKSDIVRAYNESVYEIITTTNQSRGGGTLKQYNAHKLFSFHDRKQFGRKRVK